MNWPIRWRDATRSVTAARITARSSPESLKEPSRCSGKRRANRKFRKWSSQLSRSLPPMSYALHQLLVESAACRPDAEAVRLLDDAITYRELESRSNQLAHALIETGVVPGDRIGIYLHKSPAAIASIFGVMKTGACYVPVDQSAPGLRVVDIARQCNFRAFITSSSLYQKLGATLHEECPMVGIFFIDQLPDAALPVPTFTF